MSHPKTAIVTASHAPDFARCQLLCETMDAHITGHSAHYILVDTADEKVFAPLAGPNRHIITDRDLLPPWMMRVPGWASFGGKPLWVSLRTLPLHGWHVQQLRRIAIAHHVDDDALFYCDSDTVFTKPFDMSALWHGHALRLYREDGAADTALSDHMQWLAQAAKALNVPSVIDAHHNYVQTFIAWRRDAVLAMCSRIEQVHNTPWMSVIGRTRKFSECTLYGAFADTVFDPDAHWHDDRDFCRVHWMNPPPNEAELRAFVDSMEPWQIGFGVQSFIDVDAQLIRELALG